MKNRLRLAVIGAVVLALGGIGVLVARSLRMQWREEAAQTGLDLLPQVAQRIQDFHRVKTQDGRKVWEVAAREARYLDEEQAVVVNEPMVRLYMPDGRMVALSGHEGRVALDGRELREVDLAGGIEVQFNDYTARTDRAVYQHATDRISSPQPVEIVGRALQLRGERMEVDVGAQKLRLFRNVTMTLQPDAGPGLLPPGGASHASAQP
ncbi:MAG TPA: LPS export ABC transporter periplasmic protein LptC [Candidatus Binatia bacterium]|nr:LPS export ABC transporter periplasmic protein LptC [Candidatus Binatia bacterium]